MISVLKLAEQTRNLGEKIYMEGYILGYVFGFTKTYLIGYLSVCYDSDISCYQL